MLDDDQPDRTETEGTPSSVGDSAAASAPEATAPAAPVVTRRTRKAPAKKAAAAAQDAGSGETSPTDVPTDVPTDTAAAAEAPAARKTAKRAPAKKAPARRSTAKKAVAEPAAAATDVPEPAELSAAVEAAEAAEVAPAKKTAARRSTAKAPAKRAAKKAASTTEAGQATATDADAATDTSSDTGADTGSDAAADTSTPAAAGAPAGPAVLFQPPVVTTTTRRTRKKPQPVPVEPELETEDEDEVALEDAAAATDQPADAAPAAAPETDDAPTARKRSARKASGRSGAKKSGGRQAAEAPADEAGDEPVSEDAMALGTQGDALGDVAADTIEDQDATSGPDDDEGDGEGDGEGGTARRRRRRGGRRRRKSSDSAEGEGDDTEATEGSDEDSSMDASTDTADSGDDANGADAGTDGNGEGSSRRRRRRRRAGDEGGSDDAEPNTVTRVRKTRSAEDQITSVQGSTRLEAKKQRRREGREAGRRRAPIVSEAEFLARRESVERVMVIRQRQDLIQIGVLEDKVLVEHYVARESQISLIGNVYLGRVQNVLPSMEAAFIDIGKGRNAVLYAGEVNWSSLGHKEGQPRKIESVLSSGQMVLVQVTKDPIGHKGARLTSQISLAGRFLVYVPDGTTSGISRKLPDTERNRLKSLLKEIVPDTAGVIVRTAAEGASEEELTRDVERLKSRWEDIEKKSGHKGSGPQLLYGEPDLTLKVVRDLFTEDFSKLVIEGDDAWNTVHGYVESVAPDLAERVERFERGGTGGDIFATYRIDEQIHKGLDRKVWLPSGGSLVIDRTEAMTVVDVNTGKFTGSGGNLEETVTKNNLEAAEEIVRQLRLRDIGGIIVVDFIDMVLESNRDLVVRRLVECLGRDRTRHQVAEVTSLGLVQMTRKRIGTGLLEAFSENCEHCQGRGVVIKDQPVDPDAKPEDGEGRRGGRRRGRRGASDEGTGNGGNGESRAAEHHAPSPKDVAAMARHDKQAEESATDETPTDETPTDETPTGTESGQPEAAAVAEVPTDVPADAATEALAQVPTEVPTEAPAEAPAAVEPAVVDAPVADASTEALVADAPTEAPVEDEKPRVVTRTRRRSASRPAGPPALPAATGGTSSGVAGTLPTSGAVEPGTVDVEPGTQADGSTDGAVDGSADGSADAPVIEHVPIKKKGARKR
ncbi:Rne/Rng family ribonuclease [Nocardioides renjunii]|nr:Rne/Rng family ribonuclease [Nocardioides sp. S-34]WQQ21158.1 Rne/Rng family ribonuclease [Nocardioides sp. S-34]